MSLKTFTLKDIKSAQGLKVFAGLLLVLFVISVVLDTLSISVPTFTSGGGVTLQTYPGSYDRALEERAVAPAYDGYTPGSDAEEFEVTNYEATIQTRNLKDTCGAIEDLKSRSDVIFEQANTYERGCSYAFKVEKASVDSILVRINDLDPRELSENTHTIKRQISDYTNEIDILKGKLDTITETVQNAIDAYDDITVLATRTQDVESLARIIDSKIGIVERLTKERLNVVADLGRIERQKAEQLDRLEYTYFNVSITETKYIDGTQLADSWRNALRGLVRDVNGLLQGLTVTLLVLALTLVQYLVYLLVIFYVAKYVWHFAKNEWKK
ncbi:MAG: hypothetical protein Q8P93_00505 [bacterium]|nr:hypothetical protein [bacterium]